MAQAASRSFKGSLRSIRGRAGRRSRSCPSRGRNRFRIVNQEQDTKSRNHSSKKVRLRRSVDTTVIGTPSQASRQSETQQATAAITKNFQALVLRSLASPLSLTLERHYSTVPIRGDVSDKKELPLPFLRSLISKQVSDTRSSEKKATLSLSVVQSSPTKPQAEDPKALFEEVWRELTETYGEEKLVFPKDIMWLAGAPGAGKGRMTPFIMKSRGITTPPLVVSQLLNSDEAKEIKKKGGLVDDRVVLRLLLQTLLREEYKYGVIVDGFPRTLVQAECLILFFNAMKNLWKKDEISGKFRRPSFQITVLYVEQSNSVQRQLSRAQAALRHNEIVKATGHGVLENVRDTDLDPQLALARYTQFRDGIYDSLKAIKHFFPFHFINAEGSVSEVEERILKELAYQSAKELDGKTLTQISHIPLASEITQNARHELVKRLDGYSIKNPDLLQAVVKMIQDEFLHIIQRQALAGKAIIRTENPILNKHGSIDIMLDVLSERGYTVLLDVFKENVPKQLDLRTGAITCQTRRVYELQIRFPKPIIRAESS